MKIDDKLYGQICELNAAINCTASLVDMAKRNGMLLESPESVKFFPKGVITPIILKPLLKCLEITNQILIDCENDETKH